MNKVSFYEKTLNQKIFDVIDNWAAENRIKSDLPYRGEIRIV